MTDPTLLDRVPGTVVGTLPQGLDGTFLRIGPHPRPDSPPMRWGAYPGLLYAVRLQGGQAVLESSRMSVDDAPSAHVFVDDDVLACGEIGPLWTLDMGSLQAAARPLTGGRTATIPHAHADSSGRLVVSSFDWAEQIITAWSWTGSDWVLRRQIDVPDRNYVHDAMIVGDHLVVGLHPLVRTPRGLGWDVRMSASTWAIARLDSQDPVITGECSPCFVWHAGAAGMTASDEGPTRGTGTLTLRAPVRPTPGLFEQEQVLDDGVLPGLREWSVDLGDGRVAERQVTDVPCDFPVAWGDRMVVGVAGVFRGAPDYTRCSGTAIIEADGTMRTRQHPNGWFGGEFRPVLTSEGAVLVGLVCGPGCSQLVVLDPDAIDAAPRAVVEFPVSVPAGLHSAWIPWAASSPAMPPGS